MDTSQKSQESQTDEQHQTAVPYIPPPPPEIPRQRKPLMNGAIIASLILLVGFMAYNFVGHALTQTAGIYDEQLASPTPTVSPTISPSVPPSPSN